MAAMTIGDVAKQAGVGVETIRFYERRKLIAQPRKPSNGYRTYDEDVIRRIRFIKQAQELGFSLSEIKELLSLRVGRATTCADVRDRAQAKIDDIDEKIASLDGMRRALVQVTRSCRGEGPTGECPILDALDGGATTRG